MPVSDKDKWDAKYRARTENATVSAFIRAQCEAHPPRGRCLDVAGGSGRQALHLASIGLDVTIADVSPAGLALAERFAADQGLTIHTRQWDIEDDGLPPGTWDLITCVHFLHRPLFDAWYDALTPGGMLFFEHPTRTNLERHAKPSERYLLADGEIATLMDPRFEVLFLEEAWGEDARHEARLVARRPAVAPSP